jgi:hypothetical protein
VRAPGLLSAARPRTDKQSFNDKAIVPPQPGANGIVTQPIPFDPEVSWQNEERKRWAARRQLFPQLKEDTVIFCCMNQLYKVRSVSPSVLRRGRW